MRESQYQFGVAGRLAAVGRAAGRGRIATAGLALCMGLGGCTTPGPQPVPVYESDVRALRPAADMGVALAVDDDGTTVVLDRAALEQRQRAHRAAQAAADAAARASIAPPASVQAGAPPAGTGQVPSEASVASASGPAQQAIQRFVEQWRQAWERGDFTAYRALYAGDFQGDLPSRQAWERQRAQRLAARNIQLDLGTLSVRQDEGRMVVRFAQSYRSAGYSDSGHKRLVLAQRQPGAWEIQAESWSAMP